MSKKGDKKLKKFCGLDKFLKQEHPELYDAFDSVCMSNILKSTKGITLLLPDAGYRQKIIDAVYSDETSKGHMMVKSLIIPFSLPSGKDFEANKANLINLNHHKLNFSSASADKVTFGEFEISLNKDFKAMNEDRPHSCIWNITKGEVPLSGEMVEGKVKFVKRGGAGNRNYETDNPLCAHARMIENHYKAYLCNPNRQNLVDPYLEAMVGLLKCAEARHPQDYRYLICSLDPCPMISYYTLLAPYRGGQSIVSEVCIRDWLNDAIMVNAKMEYEHYLNEGEGKVPALGYAAKWRQGRIESVGRNLGDEVRALYRAVSTTGMIGQNRLLSPDAVVVYKREGNQDFKLWQDELRFLLGGHLMDLAELLQSNDSQLIRKEICDLFDSIRNFHPGNNFERELMLVKIGADKIVSNAEFQDGLCRFVCSTDFLFHTISRGSAQNIEKSAKVVTDWKCNLLTVYNTLRFKFDILNMSSNVETPIFQSERPTKTQIMALMKR